MLDFLVDSPNWLKPLPGLALLAVAFVIYLNGYIWPWGWGIGGLLLVIGFCLMKKSDGYNF